LKEDLTTLLPEGVTVTSPEGRIQRVNHMVRAYQFNLDALAFVALLVGGFFIHNGISVAVVTRQREIGLMRALGATRGQITAMFLAESTVLGMVAWIIGIFGGWGLSSASIESVAQTVTHLYVRSQVESVTPDVALLVVSLILALFVTLVASWIPARAAARIDPVRALRPVIQPEPETRDALPYAGAGIACLLVAGLSTLAPPVDGLPWFGLVAAAALVAGFSLLLPVIYVVLGRKGYSFAASGGASARLAFSFIAAHPVRTAVATASLLAAIALVSSMEIMVSSFRGTVMEWVENSLSGDLFVRSSAGPAGLGSRGLSAETASRISKVEGVASVDRVTIMDMIYRNSSVLLIAQEMAVLARNGRLMMNDGTPEAPVLERLHGEPGVIISESLAFHHNLHEGERIDLPLGGVARSLPILKIYRDYSADRGVLRMNRTHLESMLGHLEIGHVNVYVQDDAETESVRDRIRVVLSGSELEVTDARKIRMEVARTFDQTFKITIALRSVAAVVALLGIFGTLILFAQTEEVNFAILRLIGATRGQISGMLLWMGATLGVVGTIMGLAAGVALSAVIIEVLNRQSFGWTILYRPQLEGILALTLIAPLASLVASFIPAIRVSRKQTSRILHDE